MSTLFLHIGHGKTGTSYLQGVFARNVETLASHGIDYPGSSRVMAAAARGATTSGNRALFLNSLENNPDFFAGEKSQLFSGEGIWGHFVEEEFVSRLKQVAAEARKQVALLLYIRDPVELAQSIYLQNVQQHSEVQDLNNYLVNQAARNQVHTMERVQALQRLVGEAGFDLTIHNYSRVRKSLLNTALDFLGLPEGTTLEQPARTVNRSIGAFEVGVKRGLSMGFAGLELPENTNYIRRLVDATSDLKMPPPAPAPEALQALSDAVAPTVAAVNASLPEAARYRLDSAPRASASMLEDSPFTEEYGVRLAREAVRASLVVMMQNLDDSAHDRILEIIVTNQLDPDLSMLRQYASLLMRREDFVAAKGVLHDVLEIGGPASDAYYRLITCHRRLEEFDTALAFSRTLFEFDPAHGRNVSVLVHLLLQDRLFADARKVLSAARAAGAEAALGHFLDYKIESAAKNRDAARRALEAAAAADPGNKRYRDLLAKAGDRS